MTRTAGPGRSTRWTAAEIPDLHGRAALVTGAAGGLGLATAEALAARGARVLLADRDAVRGEAAAADLRRRFPQAGAGFRALDLGDLAGIRRFATEVAAEAPALDLLINVAGLMPPPRRATTRDGFELKFGVNHLGHFALTGLLLETLLRSPDPRVISVSSIVQARGRIHFDDLQGERRYSPQRAYAQAKLACLMFGLELHERARAAGSRLVSTVAHPGIARTGIGAERKGMRNRRLRDRLEEAAQAAAMRWFGQTAAQGALPLLYAATAPQAVGGGFYGPDGFGQFRGQPTAVRPSAAALDATQRRHLWEASEELTGVRYAWPAAAGRASHPCEL